MLRVRLAKPGGYGGQVVTLGFMLRAGLCSAQIGDPIFHFVNWAFTYRGYPHGFLLLAADATGMIFRLPGASKPATAMATAQC